MSETSYNRLVAALEAASKAYEDAEERDRVWVVARVADALHAAEIREKQGAAADEQAALLRAVQRLCEQQDGWPWR